jgi:glycosyltransferase A (GT-A) superfamily protein (DUF2064 family)
MANVETGNSSIGQAVMESMRMSIRQPALAVFVKTPGLSPIKTRLADGIGRECADEFYRLSIAAVEATVAAVAESSDVLPHWAIAEENAQADPRWQRFPRLHQGIGELADRLGRVVSELMRRHDAVIAIGGDSPQLSPDIVRDAFRHLRRDNDQQTHVLGRCHDGGFYLVGTNQRLPPDSWRDIPCGTCDAADRLCENLSRHGKVVELPRLTDVDRAADVAVLGDELCAVANPSPEQLAVLKWAARRRTAAEA